ncbi:hypothetical protein HDZ31DRAFT_65738 [Schizophyllum fasciatum]
MALLHLVKGLRAATRKRHHPTSLSPRSGLAPGDLCAARGASSPGKRSGEPPWIGGAAETRPFRTGVGAIVRQGHSPKLVAQGVPPVGSRRGHPPPQPRAGRPDAGARRAYEDGEEAAGRCGPGFPTAATCTGADVLYWCRASEACRSRAPLAFLGEGRARSMANNTTGDTARVARPGLWPAAQLFGGPNSQPKHRGERRLSNAGAPTNDRAAPDRATGARLPPRRGARVVSLPIATAAAVAAACVARTRERSRSWQGWAEGARRRIGTTPGASLHPPPP